VEEKKDGWMVGWMEKKEGWMEKDRGVEGEVGRWMPRWKDGGTVGW